MQLMHLNTEIGNQGTKVIVQFKLDEEDYVEWDDLTVYLYAHPEIDITDLISSEWLTEIEDAIYKNKGRLLQERLDDVIIEDYITEQFFKEI